MEVKFKPAANFKPAASAANQLSNFHSSCKSGCVVKFYIAAAKFEKAANSCYNIYTKDEERKGYKKLSEILAAGNLKNPQISSIIYIQGERKVTHQENPKLIWPPTAKCEEKENDYD